MGVNVFEADLEIAYKYSLDVTWQISRFDRFGSTCIVSTRSKSPNDEDSVEGNIKLLLPSWGDLDVPTAAFRSEKTYDEIRYLDARGWPARSLWCDLGGIIGIPELGRDWLVPQPVKYGIETSFPAWPYVMWGRDAAPRVLPIRPIWQGFAINTFFYAAIVWLPFAPFQLRRYLRIKRGRCIKCGYDLRGTSGGASGGGGVCPECGANRWDTALLL